MPAFLSTWRRCVAGCLIAFIATAVAPFVYAQIPGANVNMVSGTEFPKGDPFLQRQNEPSIAVSTRNWRTLLGGANDFRTVDLPGLPDHVIADAWLGLFKSYDGGLTWQSTLLPGYPQDTSPEGIASPLRPLPAGADPVVRAGANGLFYYSGIVFQRGTNGLTKLFVARLIDNNIEGTDSIQYLDTSVIDSGTPGSFIDKPWLAVDIPRVGAQAGAGAQVAKIAGQNLACGNVYVSYSVLLGNEPNIHTKILLARSTDCGKTWSKPTKLSEGEPVTQGTTIAIDPATGNVYVAWRRIKKGNTSDAILFARSTDGGKTFSQPTVVASITPFDQSTTTVSFRTTAYPALTVDGAGRLYVAWSQKGIGPGGDARILMSTSTNGVNWSAPFSTETELTPTRGHRIMPALASAVGKVMLTYYDLSEDHSTALFSAVPVTTSYFNLVARMFEIREPKGDLAPPPGESAKVFTSQIMDVAPAGSQTPLLRRHTIDVRVAQAAPSAQPVFGFPVRVSHYLFGSQPGSTRIEQLAVSPPNLPIFSQGQVPFLGDYIDVNLLGMIPTLEGGWTFNTEASNSTASHIVWTDNRDVRPPKDGNWAHYTPVSSAAVSGASKFDPTQQVPTCVDGQTGMRNQNIYTSRISDGLVVGSPSNAKMLGSIQRAFVVFVQNTKNESQSYRLTIANQPAGGVASFLQFSPLEQIDVTVAPRSSISRTVFVTSTEPRARVTINVAQITVPGGVLVNGGLQGSIVLNADPTSPVNDAIATAEIFTPEIANPEIANPEIANPEIANPEIANPEIANPEIANPEIANPEIANPEIANPEIANPEIANPEIANPEIANPEIANGSMTDATWTAQNKGTTSGAYAVKLLRKGPAPAGLKFQLILHRVYNTPVARSCTLGILKRTVPIANIIDPVFIESQANLITPVLDATNADIHNATMFLGPGEFARITLRVTGPSKDAVLDFLDSQVQPVVVAQAANTGQVVPQISIASLAVGTAPNLPVAVVGVSYSAKLVATGGSAPFAWSVTSGALPLGLAFSPGGILSGHPVAAGTSTFGVQVTDSAAQTATRTMTIQVIITPTSILSFVNQPTDTDFGQIISAPGGVSVKAQNGVGALLQGVPVSLSIANPSIGTLTGISTVPTGPDGIAKFVFLKITAVGSYALKATTSGGVPAISAPFDITIPGGSNLIFIQQPTNTVAGQSMSPVVQVKAEDSMGAVLPGVNVTLSLAANPGGGTLGGTTSATSNVLGISSFPGLTVDKGSALYQLSASAGAISGSSAFFNMVGFSDSAAMAFARRSHTSTFLPSGAVFLAGGIGAAGDSINKTELHQTGAGTLVSVTADMGTARAGHTATLLPNGKILVVGGENAAGTTVSSAELFTPFGGSYVLGTFSSTESMGSPRAGHTATLLPDGNVLIAGGYDEGIDALASAEIYDPATGTFFAPGEGNELVDARFLHTATLLGNGKVLIAGGFGTPGTSAVSSAVLYDYATGNFVPTASMVSSRSGATATLLPNGKVLIAGGLTTPSAILATAELYDPLTNSFSLTGSMSDARNRHKAVLLASGKVVVVSGDGSLTITEGLASAEMYDPATGTFSTASMMATPRWNPSATLLADGRILVAGGLAPGMGQAVSSAELFHSTDPPFVDAGFASTGTMTLARANHTATPLPNGKILIAGPGSVAELYNPVSATFSATGSLYIPRSSFTATRLPTGKILIAGGVTTGPVVVASAELYDPVSGTFTVTGSMGTPRERHAATLLSSGRVLISGGFTTAAGVPTASAEVYDPVSGTFSGVGGMSGVRYSHVSTLLPDGKVLIAGGFGPAGPTPTLSTAELFNPVFNTFALTGSMNSARASHTATLLPTGKVLIAGGQIVPAGGFLSSAETYDPATGAFAFTPGSMAEPRYFHQAVLLTNGKVLVIGGEKAPPDILATGELFDPANGTFSLAGSMASSREGLTATVLANGMVLLAGGSNGITILLSAELYKPGL